MIHYILLPITFLFELYADRWLIYKGKKDVHILWRVAMVAAVSLETLSWQKITFNMGFLALASAPFMLFDPALNVLRFGWKKWDYSGKTKNYDLKLSKINPVALLVGRIVLAAGLLVYWYNVTFGR